VTCPGKKHEDFWKRWKIRRFFKVVKNTEIFQSGLVVMGNLPKWKIQRFFKEVKNTMISQNGFIVMGNQLKWKKKSVFKEAWLWLVTYPGEWNFLKGWHDRARRCIIQEIWAQRSIQKEIGPEGEWGLKSTFERR